jgi:hypothetical protein
MGLHFNEEAKVCAFLTFTNPMDSRDSASQPDWYTGANWSLDWAQDKDLERKPDMLATSSISGGCHGKREQLGLLPNITSPWKSEVPQLRQPGITDSLN